MKLPVLKRLISFAAAGCLLLGLASSAFAAPSDHYIALGDSITFGYAPGETPEQSSKVDAPFVDQLAGTLGITDYTNLGQIGETSQTLLTTIEANSAKLAGASLITLSIGGNDLMDALYNYLTRCYNADHTDAPLTTDAMKAALLAGDADVISAVADDLAGFSSSLEALAALGNLSANLTTALTQLKVLAPNAQIILMNQYNPYQYLKESAHQQLDSLAMVPQVAAVLEQIDTLTAAFDEGLGKLNAAFALGSQNGAAYVVADLYTAFTKAVAAGSNPCNAALTITGFIPPAYTLNLDFHPNQAGHDLIAGELKDLASCRAGLSVSSEFFPPLTEGYTQAAGVTFTIENIGTSALSGLVVTLSDFANFTLSGPDVTAIEAGQTATFTVTPNTGLAAGNYPVVVTVSAANHSSMSKALALAVKVPTYNLLVSGGSITANGAPTTETAFAAGTEITLTANAAPDSTHFAGWSLSGVTVEDANSETITFTMPAAAVSAEADYEAHTAADDGDCTTPVLCTVCGEVVVPAQEHNLVHHEGQAPTHSEPGWTAYDTCDNDGCNYTTYKALAPDYVILDDAGKPVSSGTVFTAETGSALTVRASGNYDANFRGIRVDGTAVDTANYDVKSGSTVVTLHADYLDTLARGDHLLTFIYADGEVSASFQLNEKSADHTPSGDNTTNNTPTTAPSATPQTGEGNALALCVTVAVLSTGAFTALVIARRRAHRG